MSEALRARLSTLPDGSRIQAIVLLASAAGSAEPPPGRLAKSERLDAIARRRESFGDSLRALDHTLDRIEATRLSASVGIVGDVVVEGSRPALEAISRLPFVTAVMEDSAVAKRPGAR